MKGASGNPIHACLKKSYNHIVRLSKGTPFDKDKGLGAS